MFYLGTSTLISWDLTENTRWGVEYKSGISWHISSGKPPTENNLYYIHDICTQCLIPKSYWISELRALNSVTEHLQQLCALILVTICDPILQNLEQVTSMVGKNGHFGKVIAGKFNHLEGNFDF